MTNPKPLTTPVRACTRCKAPIVWARTMASENGPGGKSMPLDAYPDPAGNVAVRDVGRGRLVARVLAKDEDHDHHAEQRAMPHFATCGRAAGEQLVTEVEDFLKAESEGASQ